MRLLFLMGVAALVWWAIKQLMAPLPKKEEAVTEEEDITDVVSCPVCGVFVPQNQIRNGQCGACRKK